ncbi:MAG: hypothetical protein ACJAZK_002117 [Psychroserpens sp.]|uniref:hypothetical protein n=1 Tax=Psychroserpens sp. TaxID=2020870 RepID=UPI0039E5204E
MLSTRAFNTLNFRLFLSYFKPEAFALVSELPHLSIMIPNVQKQNDVAIVLEFRGAFESIGFRTEFLNHSNVKLS